MANVTNVSSIATALSGKMASLDLPKPRGAADVAGDSFFARAATSGKPGHPQTGLPTPPNSISPHLPPQTIKARVPRDSAQLSAHIESDIDLEDAVAHANSQDQPHHTFVSRSGDAAASDLANSITPAILAKHHLPGVLLEQGPIAIRHVMNQLAQTVPGFSEIPPAKARRLVVGALESRSGGGLKGDVEFEKVGWGRWNARIRGQPARDHRIMYPIKEGNISPPISAPSSMSPPGALGIPGRARLPHRRFSHGSWTGDSINSSHSERGERMDTDMVEHEADRMSLDGEESSQPMHISNYTSRREPDAGFVSDTDSEDWESMGFEALRSNSYSTSASRRPALFVNTGRRPSRPLLSPQPMSLPARHSGHHSHRVKLQAAAGFDFTGVNADSQEREAIEALMRMGSM